MKMSKQELVDCISAITSERYYKPFQKHKLKLSRSDIKAVLDALEMVLYDKISTPEIEIPICFGVWIKSEYTKPRYVYDFRTKEHYTSTPKLVPRANFTQAFLDATLGDDTKKHPMVTHEPKKRDE